MGASAIIAVVVAMMLFWADHSAARLRLWGFARGRSLDRERRVGRDEEPVRRRCKRVGGMAVDLMLLRGGCGSRREEGKRRDAGSDF